MRVVYYNDDKYANMYLEKESEIKQYAELIDEIKKEHTLFIVIDGEGDIYKALRQMLNPI